MGKLCFLEKLDAIWNESVYPRIELTTLDIYNEMGNVVHWYNKKKPTTIESDVARQRSYTFNEVNKLNHAAVLLSYKYIHLTKNSKIWRVMCLLRIYTRDVSRTR